MNWNHTITTMVLEWVHPLRDLCSQQRAASVPKHVSSQRPSEQQANHFQDELRPQLPWSYAGGRQLCQTEMKAKPMLRSPHCSLPFLIAVFSPPSLPSFARSAVTLCASLLLPSASVCPFDLHFSACFLLRPHPPSPISTFIRVRGRTAQRMNNAFQLKRLWSWIGLFTDRFPTLLKSVFYLYPRNCCLFSDGSNYKKLMPLKCIKPGSGVPDYERFNKKKQTNNNTPQLHLPKAHSF